MKREGTVWSIMLVFSIVFLCISGTIESISFKIQSSIYGFKHPMFQTFLMFTGEYLNLLLFNFPLLLSANSRRAHFKQIRSDSLSKGKTTHFTKLVAAIPSAIDAISSGFSIAAYLLMPASIHDMLQSGQIIVTSIFGKIINKRDILRHHQAAITLSTIGFLFVAIAGYSIEQNQGDPSGKNSNQNRFVLGLLFSISSLIIGGILPNIEEKIMAVRTLPSTRMIGLEGLFGLIWMFCVINIFSFIPCSNGDICNSRGYIEDWVSALSDMFADGHVLMLSVAIVLALFVYNMCNMYMIYATSAVFKTFWSGMKNLCVWMACLAIGLEKYQYPAFYLQLVGFIFSVIGLMVYNGVIVITWLNLDRDLRSDANQIDENNKKSELQQLLDKDESLKIE